MPTSLNDQQQSLILLLEIATDDLRAGRPAQRTSYALRRQLEIQRYDDMDTGEANDEGWREARRVKSLAEQPDLEAKTREIARAHGVNEAAALEIVRTLTDS